MAVCLSCNGKGVVISRNVSAIPCVCAKCRGNGKLKLTVKDFLPQDHACFVYDEPNVQLATGVAFTIEGLKQGECCFYITDERPVDEIKEAFSQNGINVKKRTQSRALNILTKNESYLMNGYFDASEMLSFFKDAVRAATRAGFIAFRVTGESTWALGNEPGCDQIASYEFLIDEYFENAKPDITALCQYNIRRFPASTIQDILCCHRAVVLADGRVVTNNPYHTNRLGTRSQKALHLDRMLECLHKEAAND